MQVKDCIIYNEDDLKGDYKDCYKKIKSYIKVKSLNPELEKKCTNDILKELTHSQSRRYPLSLVVDDVIGFCTKHIENNRYLQDNRVIIARRIEFLILFFISIIFYETGYMRHLPWKEYFYIGTFSATIIVITLLYAIARRLIVIMLIDLYELYFILSIVLSICSSVAIIFLPLEIVKIYNYQIQVSSYVFYTIIAIYFLSMLYRLIISKYPLKLD